MSELSANSLYEGRDMRTEYCRHVRRRRKVEAVIKWCGIIGITAITSAGYASAVTDRANMRYITNELRQGSVIADGKLYACTMLIDMPAVINRQE